MKKYNLFYSPYKYLKNNVIIFINMTTLSDKSRLNLNKIKNLGNEEILSSSTLRVISIQEDFVEIDNIRDLENGLYFTFHQCLSDIVNMTFIQKDIMIRDIDQCIQNIYDNINLNSLMEDNTELYKIMEDIDNKYEFLKESYYFDSPFYNYYYQFSLLTDYVYNIIQNPPGSELFKFLKDCKKFNSKICVGYISSSEDEDESEDNKQNIIKGCNGIDTDSDTNTDNDNDTDNDNGTDTDTDTDK